MPGIFGLTGREGEPALAARLGAMAKLMRHRPGYVGECHVDGEGSVAMGRLTLPAFSTESQVNNQPISRKLVTTGEFPDDEAERFLWGSDSERQNVLRSLRGTFTAAFWDGQAGRLYLLNDRFGMRPLYYAKVPGGLIFGSEVKAVIADPRVSRNENLRGIAQFFTFGQLLNEDTFFESVQLLPAAGWLTYDVKADRLTVERYWTPNWSVDTVCSREDHLERIDAALKASVDRCTAGPKRLGISLSGGLDSRTVLALMDPGTDVTAVSLGVAGGLDHRCAAAMARRFGCPHHAYVLDDAFLGQYEEHLRRMVQLTDGHYLCQCIVMPTLPFYRELGIDVLLRGHAGELMHMSKAYNFSLDRASLGLRDGPELEGWLMNRLRTFISDPAAGTIFAPNLRETVEDLARGSLRMALRATEGTDSPVHRIWRLFLEQRLRRETSLSLAEFYSVVETRLPLLDPDLVDALMAAPPDLKLDATIQSYILKKRRPDFLAVTNANTGTRVDAGPWRRKLATLRLKVLSKLRVPGYEPYERLGLWLRRELKPLVSELLLEGGHLDPELFDLGSIRTAIKDHSDLRHNHTYLLLALMIFAERRRSAACLSSVADSQGSDPRKDS
jgi:asparagine synthase (glutamine-hydrolysing)